MSLRERLIERIHRQGPITFDAFVEAALYDDADGFFARGRGAGRAGRDFVTSPEIGTLFGALVARALDDAWITLRSPDPYLVVDAGAGNGRLARDVLRAQPRCARALRLVLVERSRALREEQRNGFDVEPLEDALGPARPGVGGEPPLPVARAGPIVTALDELPAVAVEGVVFANELLDNLPVRLVERAPGGWNEIRVAVDGAGALVELAVPAPAELAAEVDDMLMEAATGSKVEPGVRLPIPTGAGEWLAACARMLRRGYLVVIDYADELSSIAARGQAAWLRTYRSHGRGAGVLEEPGEQDITYDIPVEHLRMTARRVGLHLVSQTTQADWLEALGIDELVERARRTWTERAHVADLDAVAARSRVGEARALTDPAGLGAHRVFVFTKGVRAPASLPALDPGRGG
ncbi:MAG: SAM-dependent methyltransferase [Actinobacteria bacterium]|nr:SAM-dependent methyltransferase [Actinomycetota bacterium]